jgi:hypothetical protein
VGGSEADTLFTNQQIDDLLLRHGESAPAAREEGWLIKSAMLATLVDTTEGSTIRKMSDAHAAALAQAKYAGSDVGSVGVGSDRGTTIRPIRRRGR